MAELHHECGVAAVYHLPPESEPGDGPADWHRSGDPGPSPLAPRVNKVPRPDQTSRLIPRVLLDIQNRGQLAAGMTSFDPKRPEVLSTLRGVGSVTEVFRLNREPKYQALMNQHGGAAAIGHVRYATCGPEDPNYAQPFERRHLELRKWFAFGFNGQLANYTELRDEILAAGDRHLSRETDTEILLHLFSKELSADPHCSPAELMSRVGRHLDGAYNVVFLNARGEMFAARDPLGIRPLCWAREGRMFAVASESVALANLGFRHESIRDVEPGTVVSVRNGRVEVEQFAAPPAEEDRQTAHCFFEWIYFANVASKMDDRDVYSVRKHLGEALARQEELLMDEDTIVVPVPDTAKAAADAMAYGLGVPCLEGLLRNRYVGRTFIEGGNRADKARLKYTPLPEVLAGKKVLLVEDTIVRSTTMRALIDQLRERGRAAEVHVRVACPPIVAPCFYGIDMSTVQELFAPRYLERPGEPPRELDAEVERAMADELGADSLRYLPVASIAEAVQMARTSLCQACIDRRYPTPQGRKLYQLALAPNSGDGRTYAQATQVS
ncbi:amidophosphoribosyltransferase [Alienimonas californiensis]|uniref:Amidophosphoribosyltransferase n=1 Tax=Alienimonas californiensis TaxID=2527989 RepID=A0A517P9V1_9PLAN|nr:phosphoribosyltransferase family protein [Alienimonas californiensis]QDT16153.1 Amidophosphoribosyltransferase [Alienimonas californiensis]